MTKVLLLSCLFVFSLVFLEISFFDILFPSFSAPIVVIGSIVGWTLVAGFPRALFLLVPLAVCFDIVTLGTVGVLSLYSVILSYATSFLSRRLLVEHHGFGMILYASCVMCGVIGYTALDVLWPHVASSYWTDMPTLLVRSVFSFETLWTCLLAAALFVPLYRMMRRFDEYVRLIAQKESMRVL